MRVKTDSKTEKIQHVFSNIEIPTTQKGYTKSDGEKVERIKGEVILEIDPKLTMSLFDMRQGYIHHISMIAKYSKKVNTPRLYIYLLRQMGLDKSLDVKVEFLPMKQYLGLVELDEHLLDDKGEPVMNKYPKFSQFRKQVLDVVREDLNRMASRSETDIVFDEFSEEDFIYRNGKHKGDPEYVKVLTNGSVEAANMANNHSYDYGEESFKDTVNILEKNKIRTFGDDETVIIPVKGVNVGIFGIYELDDHEERIPQVKSDIAKLKKDGADIIVAVFHWGNELERVPDDNQVMLAHLAIDEGADVVVGHHPHVLQGIDTYKGKTIAYSLGNFCFGGNYHPTEMDTMIFQQKFMIDTSKKITDSEINVIPCSVSSESDCNNYQPTILEGDEAKRVRELIQERSDQIG